MNLRLTYAFQDELGHSYFVRDHEARSVTQAQSLTLRDLMAAHPDDWSKYQFVPPAKVIERCP